MAVMDVVRTERPFTVDDLEDMPDDGFRYELIDGELLVSPAPGYPHQYLSSVLTVLLHSKCPDHLAVIAAPFAVRQDKRNEVQPDLIVAPKVDFTDKLLPTAPLLAVEIASPSSRLKDANLKKAYYERLGVRSYWLIAPDLDAPSLTVFTLNDEGVYKETAHVVGDQPCVADEPFAVTVVPSALVAGARP